MKNLILFVLFFFFFSLLNAQSKAGELAIEAFGNYGGGTLSSVKMFTQKIH